MSYHVMPYQDYIDRLNRYFMDPDIMASKPTVLSLYLHLDWKELSIESKHFIYLILKHYQYYAASNTAQEYATELLEQLRVPPGTGEKFIH